MCYHYTVVSEPAKLSVRFDAEIIDEYEELYYHNDGFAHNAMPVITADEPNGIQLYKWGLIPHWVKTEADAKKLSNQTLNARGETVFELPSFRSYISRKRCLVLADGFFEWMHVGKEKYPHFIYMKDKQPFAFAGIYSHWINPETKENVKTYSILTTVGNTLMKKIHNVKDKNGVPKERMPVILRPESERKWLKPDLMKDEIKDLILPLEDDLLTAHTVSKLITSRTESSNQLRVMDVCEYPELATLKL